MRSIGSRIVRAETRTITLQRSAGNDVVAIAAYDFDAAAAGGGALDAEGGELGPDYDGAFVSAWGAAGVDIAGLEEGRGEDRGEEGGCR